MDIQNNTVVTRAGRKPLMTVPDLAMEAQYSRERAAHLCGVQHRLQGKHHLHRRVVRRDRGGYPSGPREG
jgi:hypothetical protein